MRKFKLVLDTNVLLVALSKKSKFNWLFDSLINEKYELLVTTPILLEYYEKITQRTTQSIAENVLRTISENPSTIHIEVYFRWNLITADPDDNAFVDGAFSGNSDYLVTDDAHFNILKDRNFPAVNVISLEDFQKLFFNNELW